MDLELKDKTAIITGSARGLGAATARRLAQEGARVVVTDIDGEGAEATAKELAGLGHRAIAVRADITSGTDVDALMAAAAEEFGGVHILVNNAGFPRDTLLTKMTDTDWDTVIEVILKGSFLVTRAVMPRLIEQRWGRVVNISSRSYLGNPGQANYSSAKAGIVGFTRALAAEQGRYGITVNAVAPGFMETEAVRSLGHYEKIREKAVAAQPLRRTGQPSDIADAVAFLTSERASFITGETLHVTGGRFG
ncbi:MULTISPECIES: 3-oxoacyl-ACP reductase FabG [unclassified Streptomyces]|uniref:3-oxoacyl-ACP reductase FabG n=1 Tax=unclassified Streptomyces TaxID=2593676 RepID=UPI002DDC12DC|nr:MULTISPECIES: 3-oxoacyl-ACP reductase FabG [unclassified Streptomyces]WSA90125.1 3-oxoacyl-ACP reductase FabG [Streptomyces sp. NBC_01795]WSB74356.1 3-oxoacyl-ACP reductase FabG [Streptomyces sp. NBC_01775]WSS17263.1 3-oxoacyl-ACP reductase FabG [Streptomyces sp. NBC_01186]WSS46005.1 3-oxoacyl-ACP reductase FabG [Streptomyces sp. NBC_01187]